MAASFFALTPTEITPAEADVNQWNTISLRSLIPSSATGVILHWVTTVDSGDCTIMTRRPGTTVDRSVGSGYQANALYRDCHTWSIAAVGENCTIDIFIEKIYAKVYVTGYTGPGVTMLSSGEVLKETVGLGAWEEINCATAAPGATGLIFNIEGRNDDKAFAVRAKGSSDAYVGYDYGASSYGVIVPCDANQVIQQYRGNANTHAYLIGYITDGVTWNVDPISKSLSGIESWNDLSPLTTGKGFGFYNVRMPSATAGIFGLRTKGSTEDIYKGVNESGYALIAGDASGRIEGKISNTDVDFYLVGEAEYGTPETGGADHLTFYVDQTGGSDSNDGLTPATAWKTIAKVNACTLVAGDWVLFKCGEEWRESLRITGTGTAEDKRIKIGSYPGTGSYPIINPSTLADTGWALDSGNIWKLTGVTECSWVTFDNNWGDSVADKASIINAYDFWWDSAADILYVYSASDPASQYTSPGVEYSSANGITIENVNYITVDGFEIRHASDGFKIWQCGYLKIQNNVINRSGGSGIWSDKSHHCQYSYNTISDAGWIGLLLYTPDTAITPPMEYNTIDHNTVTRTVGKSIAVSTAASASSEGSPPSAAYNDVLYNTCSYGEAGVYLIRADHCKVYHNHFSYGLNSEKYGIGLEQTNDCEIFWNECDHNGNHGIELWGGAVSGYTKNADRNLIKYNYLHDNTYRGFFCSAGSGYANNNTIAYNLFIGNGGTGYAQIKIQEAQTGGKIINNTTIGGYGGIYIDTPASGWLVANNIFYNPTGYCLESNSSDVATITHNSNVYYKTSGDLVSINGVTYSATDVLAWEGSAIKTDPLLDASYLLQAGSPCINQGAIYGETVDKTGNSIVGIPDIGCYEFGAIVGEDGNWKDVGNSVEVTIMGLVNDTPYKVYCRQRDVLGNHSASSLPARGTPGGTEQPILPPSAVRVEMERADAFRVFWAPAIPPSGQVITKHFVAYDITAPPWEASKAYAAGQYVRPTAPSFYVHKCTAAGTSGASEPGWGSSEGATTSDNGVAWLCHQNYGGKYAYGAMDMLFDGLYDWGGVPVPHRTDDIAKGVQYRFWVYGYATPMNKWSGYSAYYYFYCGPAPLGTVSADVTGNIIVLEWAPVSGADLYTVERRQRIIPEDPESTWPDDTTWIELSRQGAVLKPGSPLQERFTDTGLEPGFQYQWRITPMDNWGNVGTAGTYAFTANGQAVIDPTYLEAIPGDLQVTLIWDSAQVPPPRAILRYYITRNTVAAVPATPTLKQVDATEHTWTDAGSELGALTNGTTYWYFIQAEDNLGNLSTWEASGAVIPRLQGTPEAPSNLTARVQNGAITAAWTMTDGWASVLYRKKNSESYAAVGSQEKALSATAEAGDVTVSLNSLTGLALNDFLFLDDANPELVGIKATPSTNPISVSPLVYAHNPVCPARKAFPPAGCTYTETPNYGDKLTFKAAAWDRDEMSAYSNEAWAVLGEKPNPPRRLKAFPGGNAGGAIIALDWDKPDGYPGAIEFKIYRSTDAGVTWALLATNEGTAYRYQDAAVTVDSTYRYRVTAKIIASTVESEPSNEAEATAIAGDPPAAPGNLASEEAELGLLLSWDAAVEGTFEVEGYHLWKSPDDSDYTVIKETENLEAFDGSLVAGEDAYYKVSAYDVVGIEGPLTAAIHPTYGAPTLAAPEDFTVKVGIHIAKLAWTQATDWWITGVKVYMDGTLLSTIADRDHTSYLATGLTQAAHVFKICYYNTGGNGTFSAEITVTPANPTITIVTPANGESVLVLALSVTIAGSTAIKDVKWTIDGGTTWVQCGYLNSKWWDTAVVPAGIYTLQVKVTDENNEDSAAVTSSFISIQSLDQVQAARVVWTPMSDTTLAIQLPAIFNITPSSATLAGNVVNFTFETDPKAHLQAHAANITVGSLIHTGDLIEAYIQVNTAWAKVFRGTIAGMDQMEGERLIVTCTGTQDILLATAVEEITWEYGDLLTDKIREVVMASALKGLFKAGKIPTWTNTFYTRGQKKRTAAGTLLDEWADRYGFVWWVDADGQFRMQKWADAPSETVLRVSQENILGDPKITYKVKQANRIMSEKYLIPNCPSYNRWPPDESHVIKGWPPGGKAFYEVPDGDEPALNMGFPEEEGGATYQKLYVWVGIRKQGAEHHGTLGDLHIGVSCGAYGDSGYEEFVIEKANVPESQGVIELTLATPVSTMGVNIWCDVTYNDANCVHEHYYVVYQADESITGKAAQPGDDYHKVYWACLLAGDNPGGDANGWESTDLVSGKLKPTEAPSLSDPYNPVFGDSVEPTDTTDKMADMGYEFAIPTTGTGGSLRSPLINLRLSNFTGIQIQISGQVSYVKLILVGGGTFTATKDPSTNNLLLYSKLINIGFVPATWAAAGGASWAGTLQRIELGIVKPTVISSIYMSGATGYFDVTSDTWEDEVERVYMMKNSGMYLEEIAMLAASREDQVFEEGLSVIAEIAGIHFTEPGKMIRTSIHRYGIEEDLRILDVAWELQGEQRTILTLGNIPPRSLNLVNNFRSANKRIPSMWQTE